jgi:transcriptional regulator with XRE-family HTH domain
MDLQARIGRRLAELREAQGLSPHALAKAIGVTPQFVGRLESGDRAPSLKVMEALATALKTEPAELMRSGSSSGPEKKPLSLPILHLLGAAHRLDDDDLKLVLSLARRLGKRR